MATKQNDAAAMTEQQLDAVAGGYAVHDLAGKAGTAFSADGANGIRPVIFKAAGRHS